MNMSRINIFDIFLKEKKLFFKISFLGVIISILVALLMPKLYKTTFSFFPNSSSSGMDSVKSVAASIGLGVAGMDSEGSYDLTNIVYSDRIKRNIVKNNFESKKFDEKRTLVNYWEIGEGVSLNPLDYIFKMIYWVLSVPEGEKNILWHEKLAMKKFSQRYTVNKNNITGLITVNVWMEEPALSKDVSDFFVSEIKDYIFEVQYSNLSKQLGFVETRITEVKKELEKNEEDLKIFREKNRIISNPELNLQEDRLKRDVYINTEVFVTLQQELEMLKVKLVGQKDPIFLLDEPQFPPRKDKPKRMLIVLAGLFLSVLSFFLIVIFKDRDRIFE